jgi:site-specific DNA-methyltransferase (adenine-specific)
MTPESSWNTEQLFSSDKHDWATPQALFDEVNLEFGFTLDAAASAHNAKCDEFLSEEDDALSPMVGWAVRAKGGAIWLNPPYGRTIGKWIEKAYLESTGGTPVVCLTFCRTDTKWWHEWAMRAAEIRIIPGRVTFGGAKAGAPAPSCLLVFDEARRMPRFVTQDLPRK